MALGEFRITCGTLIPARANKARSSPQHCRSIYQASELKIGTRHFFHQCKVRRQVRGRIAQVALAYAALFLAAHRAFIIADNFFRMAALIGLRPLACLETVVVFLRPGLPFCFAHQAFFAAPILARAAALIWRRFWPIAGLEWLPLGGRPRRAGWGPSPIRAAIACSRRPASCLSCTTML